MSHFSKKLFLRNYPKTSHLFLLNYNLTRKNAPNPRKTQFAVYNRYQRVSFETRRTFRPVTKPSKRYLFSQNNQPDKFAILPHLVCQKTSSTLRVSKTHHHLYHTSLARKIQFTLRAGKIPRHLYHTIYSNGKPTPFLN